MNRSEAEMTRYMRRLADRDLALDRDYDTFRIMYNEVKSTAEMMPISWEGVF